MDQASLYSRSNALQKRDAMVALKTYLPRMTWDNEEETVLDVGCGSGVDGRGGVVGGVCDTSNYSNDK